MDMAHPPHLLIIDDDPGVREAYQEILGFQESQNILAAGAALFGADDGPREARPRQSFRLSVCERGEQGVEEIAAHLNTDAPVSVAFIDMKMPGIDGAETARRIWALDPRVRIVIVTAYSEHTPDDIIRAIGREDIFYLRKPFNPEEIRQFARVLTGSWHLEREREALAARLAQANSDLARVNQTLMEKVTEQASLLIQSEKMASIGILAAGVAHEINNPIAYISGNITALDRYTGKIKGLVEIYRRLEAVCSQKADLDSVSILLDISEYREKNRIEFIQEDMVALIQESHDGVARIRNIVNDLRSFSRMDDLNFAEADINEIIESALNIVNNEIKYRAEVVRAFGQLPKIRCLPQKIGQVVMNLLVNAAQAIENSGEIRIETCQVSNGRRATDAQVIIRIADTGAGIPEAILPRIFDPFFTTKPVGKGTGLGLSISYDIVKAHSGTIRVQSRPGEGSVFTVTLPVMPTL